MLTKPSLILRIVISKSIGFLIGLAVFFLAPVYGENDFLFRIGIVLWLITTGAFIGLFGVMTDNPIFHLPLPWWFRGAFIGGVMTLVLWLLAHERVDAIMITIMGPDSIFDTGVWAVLDGGFLGVIMAWFATKFGGEGVKTVGH